MNEERKEKTKQREKNLRLDSQKNEKMPIDLHILLKQLIVTSEKQRNMYPCKQWYKKMSTIHSPSFQYVIKLGAKLKCP